jgi:3-oxoacyl-ACP reductase-like protein
MSAPSANTPAPTPAPTPAAATASAAAATTPMPSPQTLVQAAKLAMQQDKAIQMDYYLDTAQGRAFLGEDTDNNEKMLVKSGEEFTSLIQKIYKVQTDFIILTENSIYLVSGNIQKRRIKAPAMRAGSSDF